MKVLPLLLAFCQLTVLAQPEKSVRTGELQDTLPAAIKYDSRKVAREIGRLTANVKDIRTITSPLGEGDPIKWAQTLPGVVAGADGSSSMYVRGSKQGSTLFSLDGVPVYAYSHILGITSIVPQSIISSATLIKGGFDGSDDNFTAAHLSLKTTSPEMGFRAEANVNNFMSGISAEAGWKHFSLLMSARVSPLSLEYKAVKGLLPSIFDNFERFKAGVGDLYGKARYSFTDRIYLELSGLKSVDNYHVSLGEDSYEKFGWKNDLGRLCFHADTGNSSNEVSVYYSGYGSFQVQDKMFRGQMNHLSLKSDLSEYVFHAGRDRSFGNKESFRFGYGIKYKKQSFCPGQLESESDRSTSVTVMSGYVQGLFSLPDRVEARAYYRRNLFSYYSPVLYTTDKDSGNEYGAYLKLRFGRYFSFESSYDRLSQYYHLLEGLPTGWALDMLVPVGRRLSPENMSQFSSGLSLSGGRHNVSAAVFWKRMDGLALFKYSQALFSGLLANWEYHVDQGSGKAYGGEFLYEYQGREFYARLAYTISRTNRFGFASVNEGGEFNARFDRPHVLNATLNWKGFTMSLSYQSGNWENGASEKFIVDLIPGVEFSGDYFSMINNYRMPDIFRIDLAYSAHFDTGRFGHDLNVGICNVTNHFNPFMLYFDSTSEQWKGLCLLPVLPNFSYRLSFR